MFIKYWNPYEGIIVFAVKQEGKKQFYKSFGLQYSEPNGLLEIWIEFSSSTATIKIDSDSSFWGKNVIFQWLIWAQRGVKNYGVLWA